MMVTVPVEADAEIAVPETTDVTPVFESAFPLRRSPVPMEVVAKEPEAFAKTSELVTLVRIVELLKVAVELVVRPPVRVWRAVHVTELAAVT